MTYSTVDTLVRMANQISDFFRLQPEAEAIAATADHIRRYWDPRMRANMAEHLAHGGAGLKPIALKAAERACKSGSKPFPPPDAKKQGTGTEGA